MGPKIDQRKLGREDEHIKVGLSQEQIKKNVEEGLEKQRAGAGGEQSTTQEG